MSTSFLVRVPAHRSFSAARISVRAVRDFEYRSA